MPRDPLCEFAAAAVALVVDAELGAGDECGERARVRADECERTRERDRVFDLDEGAVRGGERGAHEGGVVAHDALRCAGRSRREGDHGEVVRVGVRVARGLARRECVFERDHRAGGRLPCEVGVCPGADADGRPAFPVDHRESMRRVGGVEWYEHRSCDHHAVDDQQRVDAVPEHRGHRPRLTGRRPAGRRAVRVHRTRDGLDRLVQLAVGERALAVAHRGAVRDCGRELPERLPQ